MSARDQIWVCWQEPEVDCGKTSQIPYSWVTEVLIGDGRAPGSVLKCRWPKSRRLYTAKVIAPPLRHERQQVAPGHMSSRSSSGDDAPVPPLSRQVEQRNRAESGGSDSDRSVGASNRIQATARFVKDLKRPNSKASAAASGHSSGPQSLDDGQDGDLDIDNEDHSPPVLVPEVSLSNYRRQNFSPPRFESLAVACSQRSQAASLSSAFPKELQKWLMVQLSSLKCELSNNFEQVNHRLAVMDLSIRNIRSRMDRVESKIDLALLNSTASPGISVVSVADRSQEGTNDEGRADDNPSALKRHRAEDPPETSAAVIPNQQRWNNNERQEVEDNGKSWPSESITDVVTLSPSSAKRSARKTIVHRAPPISPPPLLVREENAVVDRRPHLSPVERATSPACSRSFRASPRNSQRKRKLSLPIRVKYKPSSDDQIVYLGGDPAYEISTEIYVEALENVYDESPVYLILSLLRRLLSDHDMARLWFKADQPAQPNFYGLSQDFAQALKKQAIMQYPRKPLAERDYVMKLSQATYDAKHRIRHGKGTCSRPNSYFSLDLIAVPLTPSSADGNKSTSATASRSQQLSANSHIDDDEPEEDFLSGPLILLGDADDSPDPWPIKDETDNNEDGQFGVTNGSVKRKVTQK